ncbi:MAG: hypothetical protein KF795_27990 [Labilithrix sp.]|nr:hypothetical protein [Labilithrix sp.]
MRAEVDALIVTDVRHQELRRVPDGMAAYAYGDEPRHFRLDASGNELSASPMPTGRAIVTAFSADPTAGTAASVHPTAIVFYDASGAVGWKHEVSSQDVSGVAVRGQEVIVVGTADKPSWLSGCKTKGVFIAWLGEDSCVRVVNDVLGTASRARGEARDSTDLWVSSLALAPDGSIAIGGSFEGSFALAGEQFNAVGTSTDVFVAVFESDGSPRFARVSTATAREVRSLAFDASGSTLFAGGLLDDGKSKGPTFYGASGARGVSGASDGGSAFVTAFDAVTGDQRWFVTPGGPSSEGGATVWDVDAKGNILVTIPACTNSERDTEVLEGEADDSDATCVGAYDGATGAKVFLKRMGPGLGAVSLAPDATGFWMAAPFVGRPDFGTGMLLGGDAALVHYVYR